MLNLGILGFASPWLLTALLSLPAIWFLLRLVPPAPRRVAFPALMIVRQLKESEETPDRSPWWLLLLRLLIAILLILAMAGPLVNPQAHVGGTGPITLILDDGWSSVSGFEKRRATIASVAEQARRDGRPIRLIRTAPGEDGIENRLLDAETLLEILPGIEARAWSEDHRATFETVKSLDQLGGVIWIGTGIVVDDEATAELASYIQGKAALTLIGDREEAAIPWLRPPALSALGFDLLIERAAGGMPWVGSVVAIGPKGEIFTRQRVSLKQAALRVPVALALPRELRNETARITLEPRSHGAQQALLDERWRRRTVGLSGGGAADDSRPLLSELYFVRKAAMSYAEIIEGPVLELLEKPMSLLILADHGDFDEAEATGLERWIEQGGVLLRFAGPRLAAGGERLLPVPLRGGERELGGAMSWSEPLHIQGFNPDGPFGGLDASDDVLIRRQVLAQPSPDLADATLAVLEDGTPLITGVPYGEGWLALVHTTANADWSNLALSGLFVDIIRRAIEIGSGAGGITRGLLTPSLLLSAEGRLEKPQTTFGSIDAKTLEQSRVGPLMPPGLYGPIVASADDEKDLPRKAFNIQQSVDRYHAFPELEDLQIEPFREGEEIDLGHWLLFAALLLILADLAIVMALRGLVDLSMIKRSAAGLALLLAAAGNAGAQAIDADKVIELTDQTRIGFVVTGIDELDKVSQAGLEGLIETLAMRTSIEAGPPVGVDLAIDPIDLFPLLYWPVTAEHPDIDDVVRRRIVDYLRGGGMVLIDTKDAGLLFAGQDGGGPGEQHLAELLKGMDLAPIEAVPDDHVLTRSFYLLQDFPGRWTGQTVWVDRTASTINDGVSGVIIGGHDWAGAWAVDGRGHPLFPVVPGGERQREMAHRFGVNLVMHAMTGNYKTDQVHIPALLERLGE